MSCSVRRYFSRFCLTAAAACLMASCSAIRIVQVDGATSDAVGSGQAYSHDTLIRTSIWKQKNLARIGAGCTHNISRVKVTTRPADIVLGFITAGFVVRQRIEWDCAQRSGTSDM